MQSWWKELTDLHTSLTPAAVCSIDPRSWFNLISGTLSPSSNRDNTAQCHTYPQVCHHCHQQVALSAVTTMALLAKDKGEEGSHLEEVYLQPLLAAPDLLKCMVGLLQHQCQYLRYQSRKALTLLLSLTGLAGGVVQVITEQCVQVVLHKPPGDLLSLEHLQLLCGLLSARSGGVHRVPVSDALLPCLPALYHHCCQFIRNFPSDFCPEALLATEKSVAGGDAGVVVGSDAQNASVAKRAHHGDREDPPCKQIKIGDLQGESVSECSSLLGNESVQEVRNVFSCERIAESALSSAVGSFSREGEEHRSKPDNGQAASEIEQKSPKQNCSVAHHASSTSVPDKRGPREEQTGVLNTEFDSDARRHAHPASHHSHQAVMLHYTFLCLLQKLAKLFSSLDPEEKVRQMQVFKETLLTNLVSDHAPLFSNSRSGQSSDRLLVERKFLDIVDTTLDYVWLRTSKSVDCVYRQTAVHFVLCMLAADCSWSFPCQNTLTGADPSVIEADPSDIEADPSVIESDPSVRESGPSVKAADPSVIERDPSVIEADPSVTEGDPGVIEADPGVIESDRSVSDSMDVSEHRSREERVDGKEGQDCSPVLVLLTAAVFKSCAIVFKSDTGKTEHGEEVRACARLLCSMHSHLGQICSAGGGDGKWTGVLPTSITWLAQVCGDQDDRWIEALLCALDIFLCLQQSLHPQCGDVEKLVTLLNPHVLFVQLLQQTHYNTSLLIDWLTSPETSYLAYLTRYLRLVVADFSAFTHAASFYLSDESRSFSEYRKQVTSESAVSCQSGSDRDTLLKDGSSSSWLSGLKQSREASRSSLKDCDGSSNLSPRVNGLSKLSESASPNDVTSLDEARKSSLGMVLLSCYDDDDDESSVDDGDESCDEGSCSDVAADSFSECQESNGAYQSKLKTGTEDRIAHSHSIGECNDSDTHCSDDELEEAEETQTSSCTNSSISQTETHTTGHSSRLERTHSPVEPQCKHGVGRDTMQNCLDRAMHLFTGVRVKLERLDKSGLLVYNPAPLVSLIGKCEALYDSQCGL